MAAAQRVYEDNDSVDDTLLNQISKYVFYDQLWSLARDIGIPQTKISGMAEIKDAQEKIYKVSIFTLSFGFASKSDLSLYQDPFNQFDQWNDTD